MLKKFLVILCLFAVPAANAWDWFGLAPYDESNTNRPPRLHRLLEKANDLIELAEDEALNGDGDKALSLYKEALGELDRVERENPERAEKAEFAPLRNKRATCKAAMESIRFAQINDNLRAVTVSDTSALRKKYNEKHGIKDKTEVRPVKKDQPVVEEFGDIVAISNAQKEAENKEWRVRLKQAYTLVKNRDYAAADVLLLKLLEERPKDLEALLIMAAAQCGSGKVENARRTLEKANRAHPKSYVPYYNLAYVTLDLGEGGSAAREYYNLGQTVGGPRDPRLEKRLAEADKAAKPAEKKEKKKEAAK